MPLRFGSDLELHMGMWLEAIAVNRFPLGRRRRAPSIFFSFCHPSMLSHVVMECLSPHFHSSCSRARQNREIKDSPLTVTRNVCGWVEAPRKGPYYITLHFCIFRERCKHVLLIPNSGEVTFCFAQSSWTFICHGSGRHLSFSLAFLVKSFRQLFFRFDIVFDQTQVQNTYVFFACDCKKLGDLCIRFTPPPCPPNPQNLMKLLRLVSNPLGKEVLVLILYK